MRLVPFAFALALAATPALAAPEAPVPPSPAAATPTTVREARRALLNPGRKATLRTTTLIEQAVVDGLIPILVERARRGETTVGDLAPIAHPAALTVERWTVEGHDFLVLRERPGEARGAGAYVFRVGPSTPSAGAEVLLQAPHAYFDLHTGRIAAAIMFDPKGPHPRALFVNTLQRYQRGEPDPHSPADVCHRPEHLFTWATDRAIGALDAPDFDANPVAAADLADAGVAPPRRASGTTSSSRLGIDDLDAPPPYRHSRPAHLGAPVVVQLHGFDADGVPPGTRAIVSEGFARTPSAPLAALGDRLTATLGAGVAVYYRDLKRLGGTTNVQGRLCDGRARFVHLELARTVRVALRKSGKTRRAFTRALFGPAEAP